MNRTHRLSTLIKSVLLAVSIFFLCQIVILYHDSNSLDDVRLTLQAEIDAKHRRLSAIDALIDDRERQLFRLDRKMNEMENRLRDRLTLGRGLSVESSTTIYIITPTYYRLSQKADLTRMSNTLRLVSSIYWVLVEDADETSDSVSELLTQSRLPHAYIAAKTPTAFKLNESDPNWKYPRGVVQRNAALNWIRVNLGNTQRGVVYFGDDDNSYDLRLFDQIRNVSRVGVWPVGIAGGLIVETPQLDSHGIVRSFNAVWKPDRPFAIDMAGFAISINLIHSYPNADFSFMVARGYQESHLLSALNISITDLEPKANNCTRVYVWHTRTERTKLIRVDQAKFSTNVGLNALEIDAIGLRQL